MQQSQQPQQQPIRPPQPQQQQQQQQQPGSQQQQGPQQPQLNQPDGRVQNEQAKQQLMAALQKKRKVDKALADLEAKIWAFEGSYLEDSKETGGNIVKGFDAYLKPPTSSNAPGNKKKVDAGAGPSDADRLFSNSSLTYQKE